MESAGKRYGPVATCCECVHELSGSTAGVRFIGRATAGLSKRNIQREVNWLRDNKAQTDIITFILIFVP
jgi:hypothetical protein